MKKNGINDEECKKWVIKALNDYKVHSRKQIIDSQSSFESPGLSFFQIMTETKKTLKWSMARIRRLSFKLCHCY